MCLAISMYHILLLENIWEKNLNIDKDIDQKIEKINSVNQFEIKLKTSH